jgi:hypothetical protein
VAERIGLGDLVSSLVVIITGGEAVWSGVERDGSEQAAKCNNTTRLEYKSEARL